MHNNDSKQGPESVLDQLYQTYEENRIESELIRREFRALDTMLASLTMEERNEAYRICNSIAGEQARLAFREGVSVGVRLEKELKRI